jgi:succinate dehydrogenase / fumarate reductase membrane anchor subunit
MVRDYPVAGIDDRIVDSELGGFMNLRSPLSHVLGTGSAKDGTDHWWGQRVSAVALLILGSWFMYSLVMLGSSGFDFAAVSGWAGQFFNSVMLILLALTLGFHSSLGMQVIIEDYVHGPMIKVVALMLSKFAHIFVSLTAVFAVFKLALGVGA